MTQSTPKQCNFGLSGLARLRALLPVVAAAVFVGLNSPIAADQGHAPSPGAGPTIPGERDDEPLEPRRPTDFDERYFPGGPVPLAVESLGVAMYRPAESEMRMDRQPGRVVVHIRDKSAIPAWTMSIQHLIVDQPATAKEKIRSHIEQIHRAGANIEVLSEGPFGVGETIGHLAMIQHTPEDGEPYINGWLMLPAGEDMLLVASVLTMPDDFPSVEPMLEACFKTINLRTADQLAQKRLTRLGTGQAFLESITPDMLRELIGRQLWTRIYKPEEDGRGHAETEVGYALLEVVEAKRGVLNPGRPEEHYTSDEKEEGVLVRIQGRILGDLERNLFYDSLALYWIAWDKSEEAWSVRGTQRQGEAERSETETGIRRAPTSTNPVPTLKVIRTRTADYSREPSEWTVPDVYMSQAIGSLLGLLLPTDHEQSIELSYYFYVHSGGTPTLTQRVDRWEPAGDGSGNWRLTTRLTPDAEPIRTTYRPDGTLVRRVHPDGSIAEPIEFSELRQLWERKGLPLSDVRPRRR